MRYDKGIITICIISLVISKAPKKLILVNDKLLLSLPSSYDQKLWRGEMFYGRHIFSILLFALKNKVSDELSCTDCCLVLFIKSQTRPYINLWRNVLYCLYFIKCNKLQTINKQINRAWVVIDQLISHSSRSS